MTHAEEVIQEIANINPEAVVLDGYNEAILGIGEGYGTGSVLVYDRNKLIELLQTTNKWSYEDALDWYEYNVIGSHFSEFNPIFVTLLSKDAYSAPRR